jgi:hypothetical protein
MADHRQRQAGSGENGLNQGDLVSQTGDPVRGPLWAPAGIVEIGSEDVEVGRQDVH